MKTGHDKSFHRPFSRLKDLVDQKRLPLAPLPESRPDHQVRLTKQQEEELFARAMADVTPLNHNRHWQPPARRLTFQTTPNLEEEESVNALRCLIQTGRGFVVAQTAEYMEASRQGIDPRITRRLHRGCYTIQDHIDLHGLFVRDAEPILQRFIERSVRHGCQAVLIIHGRGRKSPCIPVLKAKVIDWLARGPLRAHVIALTSARACDGGAGATYVLLRRRPIGKRERKTNPMDKHN